VSEISKLEGIEWLDLSDTQVTDMGVSALCSLKRLRELDLSGTAVGDGGIAAIASLPGLAKIRVDRTKITEQGLAKLLAAQSSDELSISAHDTQATDEGMTRLCEQYRRADLHWIVRSEKQAVERLRHSGIHIGVGACGRATYVAVGPMTGIDAAHWQRIAGLNGVTSISVRGQEVGPDALSVFAQLRLEGLLFTDTSGPDGYLGWLAEQHALRRIEIYRAPITDAALPNLTNCAKLVHVTLSDTRVTGECLRRISAPSLRALDLSKSPVVDGALALMTRFPELSELNLASTDITDLGLIELSGCKSLTSLNLTSTVVTDEGLTHLGRCAHLETLDLSGTRVGGSGLRHLPRLWSLSLRNTGVDDSVIPLVLQIPGLNSLDVSKTRVTSAGLKQLAAHPQLHAVIAEEVPFTREELRSLTAILPIRY
jgi:hypothetical protein